MVGTWLMPQILHIACHVCHVYYKNTSDPSKMTPCEPLNHVLHHGNQQHGGEEAVIFAQLGASRKEIDRRWPPSHSKGHAVWSRVVSRNSHTVQPCGSTCRFSHVAGGPVLDYWTFPEP